MHKRKAPMSQLPSAVVDDDFGKEDFVASVNDIDSDECSDPIVPGDEINGTDDSEWEDGGNDIHEWFHGEIPSLDVLDPIDPIDGVQGTESVDDSPIYPNARITNAVSMLLIMTFALNHKLSGVAIRDLLSLINIHCLVPNPLLQSLFKFKQYFQSLKNPLNKHYFCSKCSISVNPESTECPNNACKVTIDQQSMPFFIELSIIDQMKALFSRKGFYSDLAHRFCRHQSDNIEDIYDGAKYKQNMERGNFLANRNNISFTWNTDGIPIFKSSKYSIWPLYLAINELPVNKRWCSNNIILAGLWFSSLKPNMLTFLRPFKESVSHLFTEGIEIFSPDIEGSFLCRAMLLCGTCDLPAKALVYNMTQFNGYFGCTHCLQSGKQLSVGPRSSVHIYPFVPSNPTGPTRTTAQLEKFSRQAIEKGETVSGIKGPSWLSTIPNYNIVDGNCLDYMHCVLLGVTKMLLKLWFDSEYHGELWYCGAKIEEADSKLMQIQPPNSITRVPRSIQEHRKYWKASEYRAWLLYYSLPVMCNILPADYIGHHMLLVETVHTLLRSCITPSMLKKAEKMIQHYCYKLQFYYSECYMTANVHHLLHLPQVVLDFGPLFAYSCFPFEGLNGSLLNYVKGTQHVPLQIVEAVSLSKKLPQVAQTKLSPQSEEAMLYYHMTSVIQLPDNAQNIGDNNFAIGMIEQRNKLPEIVQKKVTFNTHSCGCGFGIFKRASNGTNNIMHSLQYNKSKKRNNHTVSYHHKEKLCHGQILYFFTDYSQIFAVISPFTEPFFDFLPKDGITSCTVPQMHIYKCIDDSDIHVISLSSVRLCVSISFRQLPSTTFVIDQPNYVEKD